MKPSDNPSSDSKKKIALEKLEQREIWHKIVVKIISWKGGLIAGGSIHPSDKITAKEWDTYCKGVLKNNVTYGKDKVQKTLKETKESIEFHGGFA